MLHLYFRFFLCFFFLPPVGGDSSRLCFCFDTSPRCGRVCSALSCKTHLSTVIHVTVNVNCLTQFLNVRTASRQIWLVTLAQDSEFQQQTSKGRLTGRHSGARHSCQREFVSSQKSNFSENTVNERKNRWTSSHTTRFTHHTLFACSLKFRSFIDPDKSRLSKKQFFAFFGKYQKLKEKN